ncbi:serpin family protein [Bdellovibrio sp. BCCA]|uniref:serpin family protein n=1 Tax=Bdellovibrio sp. BCCA TaxID=3136281 RepID=UPI0030F2E0E5
MKKLCLLLLSLPCFGWSQNKLIHGNNEFAFDLYKKVAAKDGNVFFSPYSISAALAMTSAGAKGKTLQEMNKVLYLSAKAHDEFQSLEKDINAAEGYKLTVANSVWVEKSDSFKEPFQEIVKTKYNAHFEALDFKNQPDPSRLIINKWVEQKTQDKIKDLLPPGSIKGGETDYTGLVLANAIYFKGDWQAKFKKENTSDREFHVSAKETQKTSFMNIKSRFHYAEDEKFQVLEMPYEGGDVSMVVFLPRKGKDLHKLMPKFDSKYFAKILQKITDSPTSDVIVALPKFKHELSLELKPVLQKMGMPLAFTRKADFTSIRDLKPGESLFIDQVYHKAFVAVDEKGTEAAAATAVVMSTLGAALPMKVYEFIADHPFMYAIYHKKSGSILFLGRYAKP